MNSTIKAGIWIDGKKAVIVTLDQNDEHIHVVPSHMEDKLHYEQEGDKGSFMGQQHISHEKTFEERKKHQLQSFLQKVISCIENVKSVYICGPAEVKNHLKKEVEANKQLEKSVLGIESCEQMSDNQLIAKVKKFYEHN